MRRFEVDRDLQRHVGTSCVHCAADDGAWVLWEEAQAELAALRAENERLRKALREIERHQLFIAPELADKSVIVKIARAALEVKQGVAAFFGKWPGDETEQELLEKLKELDEEGKP